MLPRPLLKKALFDVTQGHGTGPNEPTKSTWEEWMKDFKKKTSKEQDDSSIYFQEDPRLFPSPHPSLDTIYSAPTICQQLLRASSL